MNGLAKQEEAWTPAQYVLIMLSFAVAAVMGLHTIAHGDFWMHLSVGRWIAENGIPRSDALSFVMQGSPWINASWLYDRVLYELWNVTGARGIIILHVLVVLGVFAVLLPVLRKRAGGFSIALSFLFGAWLIVPRYQVGPHLLALLYAAVFISLMARAYRPWKLGLLVLLQVLWANTDSSFMLGPAIGAVFVIESLARKTEGKDEEVWSVPVRTGLVIGLLVATIINPYHIRLWSVVSIPGLRQAAVAREWISPFASSFSGSLMSKGLVTLALVIGAGGLLAERRRLPLAITTLAVVAAFVAVIMPYHVPMFAVLALPFIAVSLHAIGETAAEGLKRLLASGEQWAERLGIAMCIVVTLVSLGMVFTNTLFVAMGTAAAFGVGVSHDTGPSAAIELLADPAFPEHAFNLPTDGGYLLWRLPGRAVFCDSRVGVYNAELFKLGARWVAGEESAWKELAEKWNVGAAILNCSMPNAAQTVRALLLSGTWKLLFFDGITAVLAQETEAVKPLLERSALREAGLQVLEKDRQTYARALGGYRRPSNSPRLIGAGNFYMALGRYAEAATVYELLTRGAPEMVTAWVNLGVARFNLGQLKEAQVALERATKVAPKNVTAWLYLSEVYARQNDKDAEREVIRRARKLNPAQTRAFLESRGRRLE